MTDEILGASGDQKDLHSPQTMALEATGTAVEAVVGQAGETIVVNRPAAGQTLEIQAAPGQTYVLSFPPDQAEVRVEGEDFILGFDDDGDGTPDSQIVFLDLAPVAESAEAPVFQVAGVEIGAPLLLSQALALAGQDEAPLDDVAAGPGALGGGASVYDDNLGSLLDLLAAQGVIPPVELNFGLVDLEGEEPLLTSADVVPAIAPRLIVGENVSDVADETTPHRVQFPTTDDPTDGQGEIVGSDGGDVLIGDVGGGSLVNKVMNLAMVLDISNSMEQSITFNGATMTRIEALDLAVEQALDGLVGTEGATVRLHMVSFASEVRGEDTFDIIVDGVVDPAALQAAKDFILAAGDDPETVAEGFTNYEAGFAAALGWFNDAGNTLDDPDFNQTVFISDGLPNRAFEGNGTATVIVPGSNQASLDHVLGSGDGDTVSELAGLLGSFKGVAGTVDAIGINVNATNLAKLSQVDGDDANSIATGEALSAVLGDLTQATNLAEVGGDVIMGADGDDLIFGDALFTDGLAADEGIGLPPGSGWSVIEALAGTGFFDQDPTQAVEEEIMDFLRDPANQAAYDFGAESVVDGSGRDGGNDLIDGGSGDDLVFGQEGDDTILGGTGDDTLAGGSGADVFRWGSETSAGESDTLTDFETGAGGDVLDLSALLSGVAAGDDGDELDAYLEITSDGSNTTVAIDANGDGSGFTDVTVAIQGVDLTGGSAVQADIIDALLTDGNFQAVA